MRAERLPLVLVPQFFGCLLFDRARSRYYPFDQEASGVLRTLAEGGAGAALAGAAPRDREAVRGLVDHMEALGHLGLEGRLRATLLRPQQVPADHLLGPLAVHLEVIAACNLRCGHCFAGALPRQDPPLELEELDALFAELAALGSLRLGLTGGEPTMRPDLLEILDLATGHGLHPCLTTNGLLLDDALIDGLSQRPLVWWNVSLDGATPETNDPVRGAGTFARVRAQLERLRGRARFTLAFTLMRHNLHEVEACAALAREVGAHTAVFRPLYPAGKAADRLELMPRYADYAAALERLARLELGDAFELGGLDPFSPASREETRARVLVAPGCGAATTVASISVHGQVSPCSFLGPAWEAANLRERGFRDIWNQSQRFRQLRAPSPGCGDGAGFEGGCRARALAYQGSVHAPDPWQADYRARRRVLPPLGNLELDGPAEAP